MPMSFEMPELLIYIVPAFAGIIGSRYLSRLANFCVMVVIFQFDLAILFGQFRAAVFTPYTVICIIPALAGIVGDRCFGQLKYDLQIGTRYFLIGGIANALLTPAVFWLGGVLLAFQNRGRFMPLSFLAGIFVSPGFA